MSFLESELVKKHLLFDIFDIDEFVLRECKSLDEHKDIWDLRNAKRYSFEVIQVGEDDLIKSIEEEISTEEYLHRKELNDSSVFTKLNYDDFKNNFPLDEIEEWYGEKWLYDYHCNECFIPAVNNWIDETIGDVSKKLRLKDLISKINHSRLALSHIKNEKDNSPQLNEIQKKVVQIHIQFNDVMIEQIINRYNPIFPSLFETQNKEPNSDNSENPHPRIFKSTKAFNFFERLKEKVCKEERTKLADFSFVFRRMHYEKYIYERVQESEFRDFLSETYEIELDKLKTLTNCSTQKKIELYDSLKV